MKSRSEVLKDRQASKSEKVEKPSSVERTKPMFDNKDSTLSVKCEECDDVVEVAKLTKRADGRYECSSCAAPIEASKIFKGTEPEKKSKTSAPEIKAEEKPSLEKKSRARSGVFCGECGAEWPYLKGEIVKNCGHAVDSVDDPYKARVRRNVTPSGVVQKPANLDTSPTAVESSEKTEVTFSGNRISITWGRMKFPVGEKHGFKYSDMEIGSHIITVELAPGADRVQAAKSIIADLQKIAERAFEVQYRWYLDKLDVVAK